MKNAVKVSHEKSTSWIITAEAVILAGVVGFYLIGREMHPALAITIGAIVAFGIRQVIVYVEQIFWLWSVGLGQVAGYLSYSWEMTYTADEGWSLFWGWRSSTCCCRCTCHLAGT